MNEEDSGQIFVFLQLIFRYIQDPGFNIPECFMINFKLNISHKQLLIKLKYLNMPFSKEVSVSFAVD